MGEAVGEPGPAGDFGQQVGDADARQHGIEARSQGLCLRRGGFFDGRDLQRAFLDCYAWEQTVLGAAINVRQPFIQQYPPAFDELFKIRFHGDGKRAGVLQVLKSLLGDQSFFDGAILSAAGHPHVASTQTVAQFREHTEFVMTPVDDAARHDVSSPALSNEAGRGGLWQSGRVLAVYFPQHLDGAQE